MDDKELNKTTDEIEKTQEESDKNETASGIISESTDGLKVSATEITADSETVPQKENTEDKYSALSDILEIAESVVLSIFVVLLIFTFVARPVTVDGRSMNPTLEDGDKLIMNSLFYTPDVGDIVIVDNQDSYTLNDAGELVKGGGLKKRIIKRVIATQGQEINIDFENGKVYVDGELRDEPFTAEPTFTDLGAFNYPVKVPEGYVFVMGDNRNNSTDSRSNSVGFVKKEDIMGEAVFRFYPFGKFGFL